MGRGYFFCANRWIVISLVAHKESGDYGDYLVWFSDQLSKHFPKLVHILAAKWHIVTLRCRKGLSTYLNRAQLARSLVHGRLTTKGLLVR